MIKKYAYLKCDINLQQGTHKTGVRHYFRPNIYKANIVGYLYEDFKILKWSKKMHIQSMTSIYNKELIKLGLDIILDQIYVS